MAQKANARKRPNSEKMTEEILQEIWNRQNGRCFITGKLFESHGNWAASLDRINNSKGYTRNNLVLTAWIVNHTRGELSLMSSFKYVLWWQDMSRKLILRNT